MTDSKESRISDDEIRDAMIRSDKAPGAQHDQLILEAARFAAAERRAVAGRSRLRRFVPGLAVAATVVLAVGLFRYWPAGLLNDANISTLRGGQELVVPANGDVLGESPMNFEWPAQTGAVGYRLVVFDASANELYRSQEIAVNEVQVVEELTGMLTRGRSYIWVVEVDGEVARQELGPYAFQIADE